ncbi:hypothetical protein [Methylocystis bryophila]|nr:hypothetical protein DSM21852_05560 [Methylocystis bryophila]
MDEVIFEEFKDAGNSVIFRDRKVADKRVFPAIDIRRFGASLLLRLAGIFRPAIVDASGERLRAALETILATAFRRADRRFAAASIDALMAYPMRLGEDLTGRRGDDGGSEQQG